MLSLMVGLAVGLVIGGMFYFELKKLRCFAISGLICMVFGAFGGLIASVAPEAGGVEVQVSLPLASLNDRSSRTHGSLLRIDTDHCFSYYYQEDDGAYRSDRVCGDNLVKVYQEDRPDGVLITIFNRTETKKTAWNFFSSRHDHDFHYVFRVPKGTVSEEFSLG